MNNDPSASVRGANALGAQIFESSPDCVKLLDADGNIIAFNQNGHCMLEIDDFSLLAGRPWRELWPQPSREVIDAALNAASENGIGQFNAFCPTMKGTPKWWDVVVTPVLGSQGAVESFLAMSRDVTATHQANLERDLLVRELQAANERISDIFRQAPAFMCVLRAPGHVFEMINDQYRQLIGDRNPIGKPVREALPELADQEFFGLLDQVYRTGVAFHGVNMAVRLRRAAEGPLELRFVDFVYMPLKDVHGEVTGILVHGVDQTERHTAESALFKSQERFQKIVSQAGAGVVEIGADDRITLVNQKYCDMLGYTEAELIGTSLQDLTAPESAKPTLEAVERLRRDGVSFVLEKQYLRKDGSTMWAASSVNALRDAAGHYQGLVAIVVDVSESRKTSEALRSSEDRYRTLFESMDQGFCIFEMIHDDAGRPIDYRFLEMNRMFEEHTGLHDAVNRTMRGMVPDMDQYWFDTYGRVARTGEPVRFEHEAPAMQRWFDVHATRVGGPGSNLVAALFRDVTQRKLTEKELRDASQKKDDFLAMLAHELRNPLAPIGAAAELLERADLEPARVQRTSQIIGRQVRHMTHLIDDLLDVSRVTRGLVKLDRAPLQITQVINDAIEQVTPLIRARRHQLAVHMTPDAAMVLGDKKRLIQVLVNILNNAAKYTHEGGAIELSTAVRGNDVVIEVRDNGVGMSPDLALHAFDLFAQAQRTSDRSSGGLGLGLALVKSLVELHGGSVTCDSAGIGQGSTFRVCLPQADAAPQQPTPPAADRQPAQAAGAVRIMVVDDNVDAAAMLKMLLDVAGHDVVVEHGSYRAIERARQVRPQVCLLDIGLPELDGYQLAQRLRAAPETAQAVLIAVTGYGQEQDRINASAAGFDHHLIKPVDTEKLEAILAEVAKASRAAGDAESA